MADPGCQLYLIAPPALEPAPFAEDLKAALDAGPVACLQLRLKEAPDDDVRRATETLMPVCHGYDVAFLINDRPDLACELGADGVHIGQEDATYAEARALVGAGATVGVTCHNSLHLAMEAAEAGADYVAFGAFFPTRTKVPKSTADLETLENWSAATIVPCVAIGGITAENCRPLVGAGADFLAVSGGVWNRPEGPAISVRAFAAILAESGRA